MNDSIKQENNFMFPTVIDNTIRTTFAECPTRAKFRYINNLQPIEKSLDLHFGGAVASGLEAMRRMFYEKHEPAPVAVEYGIETALRVFGDEQFEKTSFKSKGRLPGLIRWHQEQWPLTDDSLHVLPGGIEHSFSIELPIAHPGTGLPLHYAGRCDFVCQNARNGSIVIIDDKTTSRLGDSWCKQWDLDPQMTGYIWSKLHELGYRVGEPETWPETVVMSQIRGVSILKAEFGHAEISIFRPMWMVDRWYRQMLRDVTRFIASFEMNEYDMTLTNSACAPYGRSCDYAMLCKSANPSRLIEGNYKEELWSPLIRK